MTDSAQQGAAETSAVDMSTQLRRALTSLREMRTRLERAESSSSEPIAIIGMGCRFPGASNPDAYWELLRSGTDAIVETPPERWDTEELFDSDPEARGKVATRWGGFLEDVDRFDAEFFGISPREAAVMDPQQRLLLEVAWETLEDGGQAVDQLAGSATGVFVGCHTHSNDYYLLQADDPSQLNLYSGTGTAHSVVSGRLSYLLDLRGPSLAIDTACSSSLVAVHLAVQSLRNGESDLALAGGVNVLTDPTSTMMASRMRMMSASGRCRPFDADGDGFVRAEGCATVLLKRERDARADGDRIIAVIKGSAVNQDGKSNGLTAPNSISQQALIETALANGKVEPGWVGMIETHGTGTPLGDPIEAEAIGEVFRGAHEANGRCALGSAKSNIGHCEGAAGVAGLIKAALSIRHGQIPPMVHFKRLNPHVSLDDNFVVPTEVLDWPGGQAGRHAGVSSFGWSGTNAHVVVAEASGVEPPGTEAEPAGVAGPYILPISARDTDALTGLVSSYRDLVAGTDAGGLATLCSAAARRRSHHVHRLAVVGRDPTEMGDLLAAAEAGEPGEGLSVGQDRGGAQDLVAFVFPGQGSQWPGMAQRLMAEEPVFRAAIERCSEAMAAHAEWSLVDILATTDDDRPIDQIQPMLFAIQVGLAALWQARGVRPDVVIGHSMGEVAAAHVAGALSLDDAARIICRRSRLLKRISGQGAMAVVELNLAAAQAAIAGFEGRLSIGVSNSPTSTVLSGDPDALRSVLTDLEKKEIFCREIKVDVASHSPQVDPLAGDLLAELEPIRPTAGSVAFFSTVTGRFEDGGALDPDYWRRNLRDPVLFAGAVKELLRTGHGRFIELSPHPVLVPALRELIGDADVRGTAIASLHRNGDEPVDVLAALGALYTHGFAVDWSRVDRFDTPAVHPLPSYPWRDERHWFNATQTGSVGTGPRRAGPKSDPVLGWVVPILDGSRLRVWANSLDAADGPLTPGAQLDMLLRAAAADRQPGRLTEVELAPVDLTDLEADVPGEPSRDAATEMQTVVDPSTGNRVELQVHKQGRWQRLAGARITPSVPADVVTTEHRTGTRGPDHVSGAGHHVTTSMLTPAPQAAVRQRQLLDSCLERVTTAIDELVPSSSFVPVSVERVDWRGSSGHEPVDGELRCEVTVAPPAADRTSAQADARLIDAEGAVVLSLSGVELAMDDLARTSVDDALYEVSWIPLDVPETADGAPEGGDLVVFDDGTGFGEAVVQRHRALGRRCLLVDSGDSYDRPGTDHFIVSPEDPAHIEQVFDDGGVDRITSTVVFAAGIELGSLGGGTATDLVAGQTAVSSRLVTVATTLDRIGYQGSLWVVTSGAHTVGTDDDGRANPGQAPLWGIGRTIREEFPHLWGGLIDLDPTQAPSLAAKALETVLADGGGDGHKQWNELAVRADCWFRPTLHRPAVSRTAPDRPAANQTAPDRSADDRATGEWAAPMQFRIRHDDAVMITGGFGAVGQQLAHWLIDRGARRLVLVGRTTLPPRSEWTAVAADSPQGRRVRLVRELEHRGAAVHLASVDVGDEPAFRAVLDAYRQEGWPPVRSVFHAAAVFGGDLLHQLDGAAIERQLRPKVIGARVVEDALPELEHLVLFSSVASLLPVAGQAAYAGANAYLDALAQRGAARGLSALSVSWGFWDGSDEQLAGEATTPSSNGGDGQSGADFKTTAQALAEAQGMTGFRPDVGFEAIDRLLGAGTTQAMFVPVDWETFARSGQSSPSALAADLVEQTKHQSDPGADQATAGRSFVEKLGSLPAGERLDLMHALLRDGLADVLKMPASRIDIDKPFGALGMDSLLAIELRNHIGSELGLKLSATVAWNYPSIAELAPYLLSRVDLGTLDDRPAEMNRSEVEKAETPTEPDPAEPERTESDPAEPDLIESVSGLSDLDALRALTGEELQ